MRPPKVAFIAPREESRTLNDAVSRVSWSLVTRLTPRGALKATFVGHVIPTRPLLNAKAGRAGVPVLQGRVVARTQCPSPSSSLTLRVGVRASLCRGEFTHDVELASAVAAGDFDADVLLGESQVLFAVRTLGIDIGFADIGAVGVEVESGLTELALHVLTDVLPIDLEFLRTLRATREEARRNDLDHRAEFLQRDEDGNFHTVVFQVGVQQRPARAAMNHVQRHFIAALRTGTTGPSWHLKVSEN